MSNKVASVRQIIIVCAPCELFIACKVIFFNFLKLLLLSNFTESHHRDVSDLAKKAKWKTVSLYSFCLFVLDNYC